MKKQFDEETLNETARVGAETFTESDLEDLASKEETAKGKAKKLGGELKDSVQLAWSMLIDYKNGEYREIPWKTIAAFGFAMAYLISPLDLVPDFIPIAGLLDDAALFALFFKSYADDFKKYCEWKKSK
ncbi:MAG: YkvA family protein [Lentisphaeria bacterium]|jgi:uncharacterized membrane protein YkvA (DUF1232 family)